MSADIELMALGNTVLKKEEQDVCPARDYRNAYELD